MATDTIAGHPSGGQPDRPQPFSLPPTPILRDLLRRASNGYERWERQVQHARYCELPVRLAGQVDQADTTTGEVRTTFDSSGEPDGIVLKACGTRWAARCEPCARVYRADAYQLVKAGVAGGKGIPEMISEHPRVFATFTAPGFGQVHTRRERGGTVYPCHAGRLGERCPHGRRLACWHKHDLDDPALGTPLCVDCYDYQGAVIWNGLAPRLWRRTTIYLRRAIANLAGLTVAELRRQVRVSYVKVAEYQARGQIHYHTVIRLDGIGQDEAIIGPPAWATLDLLTRAIRQAATRVTLPLPEATPTDAPGVAAGGGRAGTATTVMWGIQLDIRPIPPGLGEGTRPGMWRAIWPSTRPRPPRPSPGWRWTGRSDPLRPGAGRAGAAGACPPHGRDLLAARREAGATRAAAARLGAPARLRRALHHQEPALLDHLHPAPRGAARARRRQAFGPGGPVDTWGRPEHQGATVEVGAWSYAGRGYTTLGDAWLARSLLEHARQQRRIAREELGAVA